MNQSIILGTAGHIDHGKTALVKALTGVDTDRLPEEKARGITIDLGFAHMNLGGLDVSFIDVPGHERFIKNMLAGVGGIDLLLLIVAADESVMPQTREHFDICRLLEIRNGVIVITKKDLATDEMLELVRQEISDLVKDSFLEHAPVFAVSSKTGDGIATLKDELALILKQLQPREIGGVFRLPVDRIFTLKGQGTIVTGTLISGSVKREQIVVLQPSGIGSRVRSIHAHDARVEAAVAGQRTALNLQGLEKEEIQRGEVVTELDFLQSTSLLDVKITLLKSSKPLRHNSLVRLHHQTSDVLARITVLGTDSIAPGESVPAQLRLQKPILAVNGDRFIIRRLSPLITMGGGIILDHRPEKRVTSTDSSALRRLSMLEYATTAARIAAAADQRSVLGADEPFLKAKLGLSIDAIRRNLPPEVSLLREHPLLLISTDAENRLRNEIEKALNDFHRKNHLLSGIPKEELRTRTFPHLSAEIFNFVLERLAAQKKVRIQRDLVSAYDRTITLSSEEETLRNQIEQRLMESFWETPSPEALATEWKKDPGKTRNVFHLLVREQKLIKIAESYFLHTENWTVLKDKIRALKASQKSFSVSDFKNIFGVTRKFAIPLLEMLDREGVTRRSGNERIII